MENGNKTIRLVPLLAPKSKNFGNIITDEIVYTDNRAWKPDQARGWNIRWGKMKHVDHNSGEFDAVKLKIYMRLQDGTKTNIFNV